MRNHKVGSGARVTLVGWRKPTFFHVNSLDLFDSPRVETYGACAKAQRVNLRLSQPGQLFSYKGWVEDGSGGWGEGVEG